MGIYLNNQNTYGSFQEDFCLTYYVDKSDILKELVPLVESPRNIVKKATGGKGKAPKYVAITRPRRFGKTVMANMITSYFNKGVDSHEEFDMLKVSQYPWYKEHLNQHNVIHIMFNEIPDEISDYAHYISRIKKNLLFDLRKAYADVEIEKDEAVWDALTKIYEYCDQERFIFILDEWDYIYHQPYMNETDKVA